MSIYVKREKDESDRMCVVLTVKKKQEMKVLWFTNTPCSSVEKLGMNLNLGGWLRSLEEELNKVPEVELAICFYTNQNLEPFKYNGTQFYTVLRYRKKSKLGRYISRLLYRNGNKEDKGIQELLNIVAVFNPDIIHVHGTEDNFGLVQYHTNIPVVISLQGILTPYAEKYYAGIPCSIASKYEGIIRKVLASGSKRTYKQFEKKAERERRILKGAKFIIGRTDWDRRVSSILSPKCQYFVGNEILRSVFYKNQWSKKQFSETLQIVTISSDKMYKGFEAIMSSAQILKKKTNLKFEWKVIGLNEKSNIVRIVKKWKEVNFQNLNIQFLGSQNEHEIIATLLASDIFCQTSHIENSPNSLCEAMMLGMPVIATFVGGTSSLLKDKEEGILIQDGDQFSLAGAIIELIKDFEKAKKLGANARSVAHKRHDKKEIVNTVISTYRTIINNECK